MNKRILILAGGAVVFGGAVYLLLNAGGEAGAGSHPDTTDANTPAHVPNRNAPTGVGAIGTAAARGAVRESVAALAVRGAVNNVRRAAQRLRRAPAVVQARAAGNANENPNYDPSRPLTRENNPLSPQGFVEYEAGRVVHPFDAIEAASYVSLRYPASHWDAYPDVRAPDQPLTRPDV